MDAPIVAFRLLPVFTFAASCALLPAQAADAAAVRTARLPLTFESGVEAGTSVARGPGYSVTVDGGGATLWLGAATGGQRMRRIRFGIEGAGRGRAEYLEPLPGRSHYLLGRDPQRWRIGVPQFARVRCRGVLPGVDVDWYGRDRRLEFDLRLSAGTAPDGLRLRFDGVDRIERLPSGGLALHAGAHRLEQHAPVAFQQVGTERCRVEVDYVLHPDGVGFAVRGHDPALPLVIDPVVSYGTYFGGSGADAIRGIDLDAAGNLLLTGYTTSADLPIRNPVQGTLRGLYDCFVAKLDPSGKTLLWSTYLGGSGGFGTDEWPIAIAVDADGGPVVLGRTESADFPMRNAFQPIHRGLVDAVVFKLAADGSSLIYSTFLGGSGLEIDTDLRIGAGGGGVVPLAGGGVVLAGTTRSSDFPVRNARQPAPGGSDDAFLARFDAAGTLLWSTYLGGAGSDVVGDLASAPGGILLAGASSGPWPTTPGVYDRTGRGGFVTKLDPATQQTIWSTTFPDDPAAAAADPSGVYLVGATSGGIPTTLGAHQVDHGGSFNSHPWQGWVAKLTPDAARLVYGTYFGTPTDNEAFTDVAVDAHGHVYAGGNSSEHYGTPSTGALLVKLNRVGSTVIYAVNPGARNADGCVVHVARDGAVWVAGETWATSGVATGDALQPNLAGNKDGFLARVEDAATRVLAVTVPGDRIAGGEVLTGAVTLDGAAGPTGAQVTLRSSSADLIVAPAVTVPIGSATATFPVVARRVGGSQSATITAAWNGTQQSVTLRVWPGPAYTIEPLLVQGAYEVFGEATAINGHGHVVVNSRTEFFVDDGLSLQRIGPGLGRCINDRGQIGGGGGGGAIRWTPGIGIENFGSLSGPGGWAEARGIDPRGVLVGRSDFGTGAGAFRVRDGFPMQYLGSLGGQMSQANGIDRRGRVAGSSFLSGNSVEHAFLWLEGGGMLDLGTLPGITHSAAAHLNDAGVVTGVAMPSDYRAKRAFVWSAATGMLDLGTLPGDIASAGHAINSFGQVVGWSGGGAQDGSAVRHTGAAFVRLSDDLSAEDAFRCQLTTADAINDRGEIVANGFFRTNLSPQGRAQTGFRLVPADYRPYGAGCAGDRGKTAAMTGAGRPVPAGTITLLLTGRAGAPATILASPAAAQLPIGGGCSLLVAAPWWDLGPLRTDPFGNLALPIPLPPTLQPTSVFVQGIVLDPTSANGWVTTSNGCEVRLL